ncbi:MAG TPA: beta-propeller fold lactonase family protein [Rhizomicrobium sp.]|nr:beta-propeller fold lactonase family protein [Rhizomicrobium sp.]
MWLAMSVAASAEIAVSANDGKQMRPGDTVTTPEPDSISVLRISDGQVKLLGSVAAPAAMIGPPASVAVAKNSKFALVTSCQQLDGTKLVPNDIVSVVDLSAPDNPHVVQTAHAGPGASGISISPDGKLALVANTEDSTISVFTVSGEHIAKVGQVRLASGARPTDVVFTPDGKNAVAVAQRASSLVVLSVHGTDVKETGRSFSSGRMPYGAVVTRDGKYVINTNLGGANDAPATRRPGGGGMSHQGTIAMSDLATGKVVDSVVVGPTPEHVALSADGRYIAVVVANGTASVRSDPNFNKVFGLLKIFSVGPGTLTPVAQADTGHWCQGATFSRDNRTVLLQCAAEREIEVFKFNGTTLEQDKTATIAMGARPGAISTAFSR